MLALIELAKQVLINFSAVLLMFLPVGGICFIIIGIYRIWTITIRANKSKKN